MKGRDKIVAIFVLLGVASFCIHQMAHISSSLYQSIQRPERPLHPAAIPAAMRNASSEVAFVCITGQFSRLELKNKIDNIFVPLVDMGYSIHVALALDTTAKKAFYTNANNGDKMQLYPDINHAIRVLKDVKGIEKVRHIPQSVPTDIVVNEAYRVQLSKNNTSYHRAKNHVRQFKTLRTCSEWPLNIAHSSQLTVRIREDALVETIDLPDLVDQARSGAVVSGACDEWRGINDKGSFLPSYYADDFFRFPYDQYDSFNDTIAHLNPEQYYRYVYLKNGFHLQTTPTLSLCKAVTRRLNNSMNLCTVSSNPHNLFSSPFCPKETVTPYRSPCWGDAE